MNRYPILFVLVMVLLWAAPAVANNCTYGCPCGNTCIDCSDTCHLSEGEEPMSAGSVAGFGLVTFSGALGLVIVGQMSDWGDTISPVTWSLFSLVFCGMDVALIGMMSDQANEESGEDASGVVTAVYILSGVVAVWDVLMMTGILHRERPAKKDLRSTGVLIDILSLDVNPLALGSVAPYMDGIIVPNLAGFTF